MSYTPTTEEVRDVYQSRLIKTEANIYALIDEDQANAEFDRWLEQTKKLAIADFFTENGLSYRARALKAKAWEEGASANWDDPNPYRQGEGSENSNSQPTAEMLAYLNRQGETE